MDPRIRTWPRRLLPRRWLAAFVPINAATSGFGVALPLLLLTTLGGSWKDVALAATLFNAAVIVASIFWGWVSDHYPSRRNLLLINFLGFAVLYAVLALVRSIPVVEVLYAVVGALSPAGASASNLLVLETFDRRERPTGYAALQEMSMIGAVVGLLLGYLWLQAHEPLAPLLFLLAALALASGLAVRVGVPPSGPTVSVAQVGRQVEGLASRIIHSAALRISIPYFPHRPRIAPDPFGRFARWVRREVHFELPLVFAASFLFNLSANLFNISYTPYLYSLGIGIASVFLVNLANNFAQGLAFPVSGGLTARWGPDRLVHRSTYLRSLGYLAVAGFTFVPLAEGVGLPLNALAFGVMGAAIALYSTSSSTILFRAVEGRDAGRLLGLSSALGGLAAVAGALLCELLALVGSFRITFLVSAGALLASLPIWTAAHLTVQRSRARATPPPGRPHATPPPGSAEPS